MEKLSGEAKTELCIGGGLRPGQWWSFQCSRSLHTHNDTRTHTSMRMHPHTDRHICMHGHMPIHSPALRRRHKDRQRERDREGEAGGAVSNYECLTR
jgi:hypothetical protein